MPWNNHWVVYFRLGEQQSLGGLSGQPERHHPIQRGSGFIAQMVCRLDQPDLVRLAHEPGMDITWGGGGPARTPPLGHKKGHDIWSQKT